MSAAGASARVGSSVQSRSSVSAPLSRMASPSSSQNWNCSVPSRQTSVEEASAAAIYTELGLQQALNWPNVWLGFTEMYVGRYAPARNVGEAVLASSRELGQQDNVARALHLLGCLTLVDGACDEARACLSEMIATNAKYVLLDLSHLQADFIKNRFPTIYETCLAWGIDVTREPIPVVPAAHYLCGGILVNEWAESSIERLFALGECSCTGVHGANRLASVSLLEALTCGIRVGGYVAEKKKPLKQSLLKSIPDWIYPSEEEEFDPLLISNDMLTIQMTMWNYAGIIRTRKRLLRAMSDLNYHSHRIERFYKTARISRDIIELRKCGEDSYQRGNLDCEIETTAKSP